MLKRNRLGALAAIIASPIAAQTAPVPPTSIGAAASAPAVTLDPAQKGEVVAAFAGALRGRYIFPDVGEQASQFIEAAFADGRYDGLSDPFEFATRLQTDVNEVAHDKHLRVLSMNAPPPPPAGAVAMPQAESGVVRADRLAGGIGYIEVIAFPPVPAFRPVIDRAMTSLEGSEALIIDIRRNGGGDPAAVAYLTSFLVNPDRSIPLTSIVRRVENTPNFVSSETMSEPTPVHFSGVPVLVLTSGMTFSGGEGFAYDVQALQLGKVVGEKTGGGANPTGIVSLPHNLLAMIPFGRAENPVTKSNWEGRGVAPDLPAPAEDAFKVALEELGQPGIADVAAASQQQVFAPRSVQLPGTEAAVRTLVVGLASGTPNYEGMSPDFAEMTRQRLPQMQGMLASLGDLESVEFAGPSDGGDAFDLTFARGTLNMGVILGSDGKVVGAMLRPGAPGR